MFEFEVVLVGDSSVGKTTLMNQLCLGKSRQDIARVTVGGDMQFKELTVGRERVKLKLVDTSGQERFRAMSANFYRKAHAAVLVYDITRESTFNHLPSWLDEVEKNTECDNVLKVLVGNKKDIEDDRLIPLNRAADFAFANGIIFNELSSDDSDSVNKLFLTLAKILIERYRHEKVAEVEIIQLRNSLEAAKKETCC